MNKKTAISDYRKSLVEHGQALSESFHLRILDKLYQQNCGHVSRALQERKLWHSADSLFGENGEVAIVWSGMDCDCNNYTDQVSIINSDWKSIRDHVHETYKWADGPCGYYITKPSKAQELEYHSRDLAMEAFEDGHPHVVYM